MFSSFCDFLDTSMTLPPLQHKERAPRESKLLPEFKQCIDYLNQFLPEGQEIIYIPWDIAAANKQYVHPILLPLDLKRN